MNELPVPDVAIPGQLFSVHVYEYDPLPPVATALTGIGSFMSIVVADDGCAVTSTAGDTVIVAVLALLVVTPSFAVNVNTQFTVAEFGVYVNVLPVPVAAIPGQLLSVHEYEYEPVPPIAIALIGTGWLMSVVTGDDGCASTSNTDDTVIAAVFALLLVTPSFAVNVNTQFAVDAVGVYVNALPVPAVAIPGQVFAVHEYVYDPLPPVAIAFTGSG